MFAQKTSLVILPVAIYLKMFHWHNIAVNSLVTSEDLFSGDARENERTAADIIRAEDDP